jgi:methionyl-tRNA formyltransferase
MECTTVFPGVVQDFFKKSDVMRDYFSQVMSAERLLFGDLAFMRPNVRSLAMKSGDLQFIERRQIEEALNSDVYVVFGSSYIKGWLVDYLVERRALNIHMGISPYYRGSSCNFWALYDARPEYVGATIHMLSKGLDSGPILYHALPTLKAQSPFEFTMGAVEAAQKSLVERIGSGEIKNFLPQVQNKQLEIRYTKNADFTDEVATEFLSRRLDASALMELLNASSKPELIHPYYALLP